MAKYLVYVEPQVVEVPEDWITDDTVIAWLVKGIREGSININVKEIPNG